MCFSAQASFTSGAVITTIGIGTLLKAKKPEQKPFALIPLLFGFQQFAEGILWVTLKSGGNPWAQNVATHAYLTAALVIWPLLVPFSMLVMETGKIRKIFLAAFTLIGLALSVFYAYSLIVYQVYPQINSFHIQYVDNFRYPAIQDLFLFYFAATVAPLFISSVRRMWLFGILISVSLVVTGFFFREYLTSVWCFFASGISAAIYFIVAESRVRVPAFMSLFQH